MTQIKNNGAINLNHELKLAFAIAIAPTVAPNVGVIKLPNPPPKDSEVNSIWSFTPSVCVTGCNIGTMTLIKPEPDGTKKLNTVATKNINIDTTPAEEPSSCVVNPLTIVLKILPFSRMTLIVFAMIIAKATTSIGLAPARNPSTISLGRLLFIK